MRITLQENELQAAVGQFLHSRGITQGISEIVFTSTRHEGVITAVDIADEPVVPTNATPRSITSTSKLADNNKKAPKKETAKETPKTLSGTDAPEETEPDTPAPEAAEGKSLFS